MTKASLRQIQKLQELRASRVALPHQALVELGYQADISRLTASQAARLIHLWDKMPKRKERDRIAAI